MVRLKYGGGVTPRHRHIQGTDFLSFRDGEAARNQDRYRTARSPIQEPVISCFAQASQKWRTLTSGQQASWDTFATVHPVPTRRNSSKFLSGFQIFQRRWFYGCVSAVNKILPVLETDSAAISCDDVVSVEINISTAIELSVQFATGNDDFWVLCYMSRVLSAGVGYVSTQTRYVGVESSSNFNLDVTANYLFHFGSFPAAEQIVFASFVLISKDSGVICLSSPVRVITEEIPIIPVNYGRLYNHFSVTDARNLCPAGWHVPSAAANEYYNLMKLIDPSGLYYSNNASAGAKQIGTTHWNSANGLDTFGFSAVGNGNRDPDGTFRNLKNRCKLWSSDVVTATLAATNWLNNGSGTFYTSYAGSSFPVSKNDGAAIRPIKNSTILPDGASGTYVGNDGRVYPTICIDGVEWLAVNLAETKFRTGALIPNVTSGSTWAGLSTAAMCAFDNDESNV